MVSSQSRSADKAKAVSPPADKEIDLHAILTEKIDIGARFVLWSGVIVGLWFLIGAYDTSKAVIDYADSSWLLQTWHEWVWVGAMVIGIAVSAALFANLMARRQPGEPPYFVFAAFGLLLSVAVLVILVLDSFELFPDSLSSDGGGALWPGAKPLWLMPLSALGLTTALLVEMVARRADPRDNMIGAVLSCVPMVMLSVPLLLDFEFFDTNRWMSTIYAVSGVALLVSGLRLHLYASGLTLESMEYYMPRLFGGALVAAGLVAWLSVVSDEPLPSSDDMIWFLPLVSSTIASVMLLATIGNTLGARTRWDLARVAAVLGLSLSLALVYLYLFVFIGLADFERSVWLYPLSLLGMSLVMCGVNMLGPSTTMDRTIGILYAVLPTVVTTAFAVVWYLQSTPTLAHPLLSGRSAMLVYLGFAVAVIVSGLRAETFFKVQWPVVREKMALSRKRTRTIMRQVARNPMGLIGIVILVAFTAFALLGPYIAPYEVDMRVNGVFTPLMKPSAEHWMGTDTFGHDIFSELLYGAKTSMTVGIVAAMISSFLGALIGLYSGYVGGWRDEAIMRLNDIVLSIPWLVLMIIIAAFMGSIDLVGIILVIGLTGWSMTARLVRAQVLSLRERQYIERAHAIGSDDMHIIKKHILPNAFPLVFANTILTVAVSILSEATLSFLGLRPYGSVTWGTMLSYAQIANAFAIDMHMWIVAPGVCIVLVVLGFTLLGYAMDDVMNPKLRKR